MTYSGGSISIRNGRTWRNHARASFCDAARAACCDLGRVGISTWTVSAVCNSDAHSRRNFSPRLRPSARITACAPVLNRTSSALGGGNSVFGRDESSGIRPLNEGWSEPNLTHHGFGKRRHTRFGGSPLGSDSAPHPLFVVFKNRSQVGPRLNRDDHREQHGAALSASRPSQSAHHQGQRQ